MSEHSEELLKDEIVWKQQLDTGVVTVMQK